MSLLAIISNMFNSASSSIPKYFGYQALNNEGHPTHGISSFQHKHSVYYSGKTYFLWMATDALKNINSVFSFDHSTKEISASYDTLTTKVTAGELHSHGSIFVTSSGTLIVSTVSRTAAGTDSGLNISTASALDITTWTPIAQGEIDTGDCQYSQISQIGSRIFLWYRKSWEELKIMYSDDEGATWSTPVKFFDYNVGDRSEWIYPYGIHNNGGDKIYLILNRRYYDTYPTPSVQFPQRFYLESEDGNIFSNKSGTWSKNINTEGYITLAELIANCLIEDAVSMASVIWNCGGVIGSDGEIYLLSQKEGGGVNFTFWNGSSWTIREITTDYTFVANATRLGLYQISANSFRVWILETIAGDDHLTTYTTADKGLTWNLSSQITTENTHYSRADVTDNIQTSGEGLLATIKGDGTGLYGEIFIQEI